MDEKRISEEKRETEGLIIAAQDQSSRTRWVKHNIDRTTVFPKFKMSGKIDENVSHIVSECNELAQNEYKKLRHNKVAALLQCKWCVTNGFEEMRNMNTSLKRK